MDCSGVFRRCQPLVCLATLLLSLQLQIVSDRSLSVPLLPLLGPILLATVTGTGSPCTGYKLLGDTVSSDVPLGRPLLGRQQSRTVLTHSPVTCRLEAASCSEFNLRGQYWPISLCL